MKFLSMYRGGGKTLSLLLQASQDKVPILISHNNKKFYENFCKSIGLSIRSVDLYTIDDIVSGKHRAKGVTAIYVDDTDEVLSKLLQKLGGINPILGTIDSEKIIYRGVIKDE